MKITINEHYYIDVDTLGNHTPYFFKKGGELITFGKNKGIISQDKWVSSGKYYTDLGLALDWIVKDSLQNDYPEIDLKDYLTTYEERVEDIKSITVSSLRGKVVLK